MIQHLYRLMIELTNGKWTSKALKLFARSRMSRHLIPSFSKVYRINESEMDKGISEYITLQDFFTRKLKTGMRIPDQDQLAIISPVDAVIEDIGLIESNHVISVKGKKYSIKEMLGKENKVDKYAGGYYMIFYLSPSHYHRIHSPVTGKVVDQWTLGKKSYPVNRLGLKYGKSALSKNYRTITEVKYSRGAFLSIVKVGAMFVNSIEVIHEGEQLIKGDEMAYFTFGSTVVLLFEKNSFTPLPAIKIPHEVKVGERIGNMSERF